MAIFALQDELKKDCINKIELHTLSEDVSFYEKNGFKRSSYANMEKVLQL